MARRMIHGKNIKEEAQAFPSLRAVRLSRNFGKELALCAGLERARGDVVVVMDGDGQHPPSLLPMMVEKWRSSGADIVHAVKTKRGREPVMGKVGAFLFYLILNKLSGFDLKGASDFKLVISQGYRYMVDNARTECVFSWHDCMDGLQDGQDSISIGRSSWVANQAGLILGGLS